MALAFLIGAAALFTLNQIGGTNPVGFVLVTALYFGVYGEIFSLFPATQGDTFGSKFAAANAGMLYTAKGTGALLVPIMAALSKAHGYWLDVHHLRDIQHHRGIAGPVCAQADAGSALRRGSPGRCASQSGDRVGAAGAIEQGRDPVTRRSPRCVTGGRAD